MRRTYWETASRFEATHISLLISMINVLFKQPERPSDRMHRVRVALTAGTTRAVWPDFERRFGLTIIELYGMTECGCTTLMNPPDAIRVGSVGTPLGFVEADVVDDDDRPVPVGIRGELIVRPRTPFTMFSGYLGKPEKTVEAWRNLWFHTGDFVTRDADGYYYFVDRKKDVIRRRGENLAPYDVESVLNRHPAVLESVVVGVPSPLGEEDVKAFVQLKPGTTLPTPGAVRVRGREPPLLHGPPVPRVPRRDPEDREPEVATVPPPGPARGRRIRPRTARGRAPAAVDPGRAPAPGCSSTPTRCSSPYRPTFPSKPRSPGTARTRSSACPARCSVSSTAWSGTPRRARSRAGPWPTIMSGCRRPDGGMRE